MASSSPRLGLDYAAIVGGCVGASTPAGARLAGLRPTGTMPHSLVLMFGDTVKEDQTLLIVEAMKTMNPIPAPKAGKVVQIMVSDARPVEYGEVLMIIE